MRFYSVAYPDVRSLDKERKVGAADPPLRLPCHSVPCRCHIVLAFLTGGRQVGNPTARPVVIPVFYGYLGEKTKWPSMAITSSVGTQLGAVSFPTMASEIRALIPRTPNY